MTVRGISTRPTSERVKESLFNIIARYVPCSNVLDLFAGTGSLGIEALSRGANFAVFVDKDKKCAEVIKNNLSHTKMIPKAAVIIADIKNAIAKLSEQRIKFDIIFLDPPYGKNFINETLKIIAKSDIINKDGMVIAEHSLKDDVSESVDELILDQRRCYGSTVLSFFKRR